MLDTNIWVSMIFFPSDSTREFGRKVGVGNRIILCDYVIEELRLVTERKFSSRKNLMESFFYELPFELVHTPKGLDMEAFPNVRDVKDSPILATAILEDVDVFVTGDLDFLVLETERPEIMKMKEFTDRY
jgi:predicted nucleic acid-binding protein